MLPRLSFSNHKRCRIKRLEISSPQAVDEKPPARSKYARDPVFMDGGDIPSHLKHIVLRRDRYDTYPTPSQWQNFTSPYS